MFCGDRCCSGHGAIVAAEELLTAGGMGIHVPGVVAKNHSSR